MSHCAADDDGTLYSLRKKEKNRISSDSYVTISYDSKDKTIYQIKAKANQVPPEKFWNHIAKFIEIVGAEDVKETGEYTRQEREFALLNNFLSEKTGINSKNSYKVKEEEMVDALMKEVEEVAKEREAAENGGREEIDAGQ